MCAAVNSKFTTQWALICSVPDEKVVPQLSEFSIWFLDQVTKEAEKIGIYFEYEEKPIRVQYVTPGNLEDCFKAYQKIHDELPAVQFVIHILPKQKSDEYDWMKSLASRNGVVRQGVLLENALNRFDKIDHREAFTNVAQWVSRSSHKLCTSKDLSEKVYDVRVGAGSPSTSKLTYNPRNIQAAVNMVLHGDTDGSAVCREESKVRVEGLPMSLSEFGVAQLFSGLTITGVSVLQDGAACVTFANKFLAFQAAQMYDKKELDRRHKIRVLPMSDEVKAQLVAQAAS